MRRLLVLEEVGLLTLAIFLLSQLDYSWWIFPVLFFVPDVSLFAYAGGPRLGAIVYNLLHHRGVGIVAYMLGVLVPSDLFQLVGLVILGHASFDRIFGYGLKYPDAFKHTHLGWIGGAPDR